MVVDDIFSIKTPQEFERLALEIFKLQARHCHVYRDFINILNIDPDTISNLEDVPYLPIEFFKSHKIVSSEADPDLVFTSSGTTGILQSRHPVTDLSIYEKSYRLAFEQFYGDIRNYALLALLPSYQEREGSSLIYMVDDLIRRSGHHQSGYFLYNHGDLAETLIDLKKNNTHTLLIGVTYALLDFAESHTIEFPELIVMETGGMKGKRREMIRLELHESLCQGFGIPAVHSEYGMTELLSQAYSKGGGIFHCPKWMKVLIRDTNDPLELLPEGQTGGINVIDLANINSCSFIATQDLGKLHSDGGFEVLGRFDNSDIRGCNLLVQ
ncbi:MAG TPA: hypothetical protein VLZ28_00015 [Daejeonella sp.]|nr:hypothetical protein [Daejeonella sp.]